MPLVSRSSIEQLRETVDIVDVIGSAVTLKRRGKNWVGLSPFTSEKTPSFNVLPEKGIFYCFSSGYSGDIFRFLELHEKLNFQEAVEALARRYNVTLEYEQGRGPTDEERTLRRELLEIHDYAAAFFSRAFNDQNDPHAAEIRRYWTEDRRFSPTLAEDFRVGWAPTDAFALARYLAPRKFSLEALRDCGLFYVRDGERNPRNFRSRFRGRLMIPIRNHQEEIIAFTARQTALTPEDDPARQAKYINSPETPLFSKSHIVFNLERARKHADAEHPFVMVEGQLDALRCWEVGLKTAVAPQGTSVTAEQLARLRRYAEGLDCLMDGDEAGQKAALRLIPLAWKAGLEPRFLVLAPGDDPDAFLREHGVDGYRQLAENAQSAVAFALRALLPEDPSPADRRRAMTRFFGLLREADSALLRSESLREAATILQLDPQAAAEDFARLARRETRRASPETDPAAPAPDNAPHAEGSPPPEIEEPLPPGLERIGRQLLALILQEDELAHAVGQNADPAWLEYPAPVFRLLNRILADIEADVWEGRQHVDTTAWPEAERNLFFSVQVDTMATPEDTRAAAEECLQRLRDQYLRRTRQHLQARLNRPDLDEATFRRVASEMRTLRELQKQPVRLYFSA